MNAEVVFDINVDGFRVSCEAKDEWPLISRMSKAFEAVNNASLEEAAESCLVRQGRLSMDNKELEKYKAFGLPHDIVACSFQSCWTIRSSLIREGLTIQKLLGPNDAAEFFQEAGCIIRKTRDGASVWLGAQSSGVIQLAKQRLDMLLKYYVRVKQKSPLGHHV
jgi:hypothetical protein